MGTAVALHASERKLAGFLSITLHSLFFATLLLSTALMRAAAIFGPGFSPKILRPFQDNPAVEWHLGMPSSASGIDIVLIFGGDGTIHRNLSALVALDVPVLVVPIGSGNDFARALGMRNVRDSLEAWQKFCRDRSNVRAIDLGVIRPLGGQQPAISYFCSVAAIGLDAEVARRANTLPRWLRGHGGYALSLVPALFRFTPLPMKISTSDRDTGTASNSNIWTIRSDRPIMLAAFANTSTYGGGMNIAPNAKPDDGLLDACVIGALSPFKLASMFPTVYFGRHLNIRGVDSFQSPRVRVETEHPLDVYADGEFVCRTPVEISAEMRALHVLTNACR